jgi:hypothetical protein
MTGASIKKCGSLFGNRVIGKVRFGIGGKMERYI